MGSVKDSTQSLEEELLVNENRGEYTGDGSVDLIGNPVSKYRTGRWKACPFILANECCERLAFFSIATNLVTYLNKSLHQSNVSAAKNMAIWEGTCYLAPLLGALLADAYWGRFKTIAIFSVIYFLGMSILTLSASVPSCSPPPCSGSECPEANTLQYGILFFGLYMVALGTGGIKPCVLSFGVDQFDDTDPTERVSKASFFNWYYFILNIGAFIASTMLVWVQDNYGWGLGFAIPTMLVALAIASFFSGTSIYRFRKPGGSPLTRVCQVVVASIRKWRLDVPRDSSLLYELPDNSSAIEGSRKIEHSNGLKFLDKAATMTDTDRHTEIFSNPWCLCTVTQVEELKILVRLFPIWTTGIVFGTVCSQRALFIEQGMALDSHIGPFSLLPASLSAIYILSIIICIPIYDKLLVPLAKKFTGRDRGFTALQRIGVGLVIGTMVMASAALVEMKRLEIARTEGLIHQKVAVPMSILWQVPQYLLTGVAEVFALIGLLEFFYDESPDAMKSLCNAFVLLTLALGNYLSSALLTSVRFFSTRGGKPGWIPDCLNEGHLDYFFCFLAGINVENLLIYVLCARKYKGKKSSSVLAVSL